MLCVLVGLYIIENIISRARYVVISEKIDNIFMILSIPSFILLIICLIMDIKYKNSYLKHYKEDIVSNFVKLTNEQLAYKPEVKESCKIEEDYKKADFDGKKFNRFFPDDYIEGNLDECIFVKMADLHIQNKIGEGKYSHTEEMFYGIFAFTKCDKKIKDYIKITPNKIKVLNNEDRIEMDSQEFEKYFDIYSTNKILTMRLLTHDIMECLMDFRNKYNLKFDVAFRDDNIYLRFHTGAMFEPKVFGNSMDKELLFIYYSILKFAMEVTKKVNKVLQEIEL